MTTYTRYEKDSCSHVSSTLISQTNLCARWQQLHQSNLSQLKSFLLLWSVVCRTAKQQTIWQKGHCLHRIRVSRWSFLRTKRVTREATTAHYYSATVDLHAALFSLWWQEVQLYGWGPRHDATCRLLFHQSLLLWLQLLSPSSACAAKQTSRRLLVGLVDVTNTSSLRAID